MSHLGHDALIEFEEDNYDWLTEKFIRIENVRRIWDDFVMDEYNKTLGGPEDDPTEDR